MAERSAVVYLHLRPGRYGHELFVDKMTKSEQVTVEPGVVVVKMRVRVPDGFFQQARPYHEVVFNPPDALTYLAEAIEPEPDPEEDA